MVRRLTTILLCAALLLTLFAGCAGTATPSATTTAATTAATTKAAATTSAVTVASTKVTTAAATTKATIATTTATTAPPEAKPAQFTAFWQEAGQNFPDGYDHLHNAWVDTLCEWANVEITSLIVPAYADTTTKFNLMMSSGEIPDFVEYASRPDMQKYGMDGAFLELTPDIINQMPLVAQTYSELQFKAMQSEDGHIYALSAPPINHDFDTVFARWDLYEKMGIEEVSMAPADLIDAGKKLLELYPDAIPYTTPGIAGYRGQWLYRIFNTFPSGYFYNPELGKVVNYWEGDNIVTCVSFLRDLYAQGLLDPEFMTSNGDDNAAKRATRNVLLAYGNVGSYTIWLQQLYNAGKTDAILIPVGCNFVKGVSEKYDALPKGLALVLTYTFGINRNVGKDKEKLAGILRFLNILHSEQVLELSNFGREGIEYKLSGNEIVPIEPAFTESSYRSLYGWVFVNNAQSLEFKALQLIKSGSSLGKEGINEFTQMYLDSTAAALQKQVLDYGYYNPLDVAGKLPDEITNNLSNMTPLQQNLVGQVILGEISIDDFIASKDEVVAQFAADIAKIDEIAKQAKINFGM